MASAFKKHYFQISTAHPSLANAKYKPANGKFTYPILFPTAELAKSFIAEARENTPFWMDSKDGMKRHLLRVGADQPLPIRLRKIALSKSWAVANALLHEHNCLQSHFNLGTDPFKGTVFLVDNDEYIKLVQLTGVGGDLTVSFTVKPFAQNLKDLGIPVDKIA
eukprot:7623794-Pyramimonas_sp.AAC.1